MVSVVPDPVFDAHRAAAAFVQARRAAGSLTEYPGVQPADLESAYRCQDAAIAMWGDAIIGWKVGWIPAPLSDSYGAQRLVGPIFRRGLRHAQNSHAIEVPVFAQGFGAIEAEFVVELAWDVPPDVSDWTAETARRLVKTMYIGIEIASSPLQNINDFGPAVVISDFGNNAGLLLGPEIPGWQTRDLATLTCETRIDGEVVGRGSAASVSGGPLAALAFALGCNARRRQPMRAGTLVSTGAVTGVHSINAGQSSEAVFTGVGVLRCVTTPMTPVA